MVRMRTSFPGRWLVIGSLAIWFLAVLTTAAWLIAPAAADSVTCELSAGGSVFGEASRSWIPPGTTCTYDLGEYGRYVTGPAPARLIVVAVALVAPPVIWHLTRLLRRTTPTST